MEVDIRLAAERLRQEEATRGAAQLVTPGDTVTGDGGFMRGHGTYKDGENLVASVAGFVRRINRLISVQPLKARYNGEIGDVVIGRVIEVQQKRWKVDTCSRLHSLLMLSSVNLPGGEQRRKTQEDELAMRSYLEEGDLISAEVQNIFSDGSLSLHTRSLKYGKLSQGVVVAVPSNLVLRRKNHFHDLPCGATVILGNNGYIWICATVVGEDGGAGTGGYVQNLERVPLPEREVISRLRNCILALAGSWMMLYDTSILYAFEASSKFQVGAVPVSQEPGSGYRVRSLDKILTVLGLCFGDVIISPVYYM
ncbi:exosome complex component RRP4-like isoform X2 [Amphibalanus amphitrite]|uniref:exosome complex component RRP4-like isoform X2 n=1 Tax=Amphibalanus amphitrite TaxID=1232801 RepID=UPI001C91469D|nr:exosome complex component RRP4-like isoform X2 [Amphibalanus amphitrite]